MHGFIHDIGISIIVAMGVSVVTHLLRQPMILAYLIAGVVIGPEIGPKLITDPANIATISEIGLILLLFIVGLEINLRTLFKKGRALTIVGVGSFLISVFLGMGFFSAIGFEDSLYLSLFCALSSTAIVVKILYDKAEMDTLHGKMTVGILIFQDIWAILILILQPNFSNPDLTVMATALIKGLLLVGFGILMSQYVLRYIFKWVSNTPEMVVVVAIGWCAIVSGLAYAIGISMEMGALIAGMSISTFSYSFLISSRIHPLRDFFLTLFFISFGMKIPLPQWTMLTSTLIVVGFVVVSRFMAMYPLLWLTKNSVRTSFITSLNLAQISEFSLVIGGLGLSYGHIKNETMSLLLYAMALTSIFSSYTVKFNHAIYFSFQRLMGKHLVPKESRPQAKGRPIVILGFHRGAQAFLNVLLAEAPEFKEKITVIDFNAEVLEPLKTEGIECIVGDLAMADTLRKARIKDANYIISAVSDTFLKNTSNLELVKSCRRLAPKATILATSDFADGGDELLSAGASEVIMPYVLSGSAFAHRVIHAV